MSDAIAVLNAGCSALCERVCRGKRWPGIELDAAANAGSAWVIPTNEELMIARHTLTLLARADVRAAD